MGSKRFEISEQEAKKWTKGLVLYVVLPTLIAFLTALKENLDIKFALGAAFGTIVASMGGLVKTYLTDTTK